MTNEYDQVSVTDIAEWFGVTRQRVLQLIHFDDFPIPTYSTRSIKLWRRTDVEMWGMKHRYIINY